MMQPLYSVIPFTHCATPCTTWAYWQHYPFITVMPVEAGHDERLGGLRHGGKKTCLENVLGKLSEFGLRAGMAGLDKRALLLMRIFHWKPDWKSGATIQNTWETLVKSVFAWGLLRMGYEPQPCKISCMSICVSVIKSSGTRFLIFIPATPSWLARQKPGKSSRSSNRKSWKTTIRMLKIKALTLGGLIIDEPIC